MPADSTDGPRPPAPIPHVGAAGPNVTGAIRRAAKSTGASFEYLLATAKVESNLNPNASAPTSSATGLFQMLEQTWLGVMKTAGRAFGFNRYADAITQTSSGRYVVDDPALRDEMMKLRKDASTNAIMGGVLTQQNAAVLAQQIGRKPTEGELYIAHFLGASGAARVITQAAANPNASAAEMFPAAAAANRSIFYDRQGNARTVAGVQSELIRRFQVAKARTSPEATAVAAAVPAPSAPSPVAAAARGTETVTHVIAAAQSSRVPGVLGYSESSASETRAPHRSAFHSLFETGERRGAISPMLTDLWTPSSERTQTAPESRSAPAKAAPAAPAAAAPAAPGAPLDLFQELRPNVRALFRGRG